MNPDEVNLPAFLCARRCGVTRQLFYTWIRRGLITQAGTGRDGRPLYDVRHALAVERDTALSGVSHRGPRGTDRRTQAVDRLRAELAGLTKGTAA